MCPVSTVCQGIHLFNWAAWWKSGKKICCCCQAKYSSTAAEYFRKQQQVSLRNKPADKKEWDWQRQKTVRKQKRWRRWKSDKMACEEEMQQNWAAGRGDRRRARQAESWLPFVHTRYELLMPALNKLVQCTGRGRWVAQCESPKITSKNGPAPERPGVTGVHTCMKNRCEPWVMVSQNQWLLLHKHLLYL